MSTSSYNDQRRLYNDLAWTFPIISGLELYVDEAQRIWEAIREHSRIPVNSLLDLGSGLGHIDFFLKKSVEVTGVDTSVAMRTQSQQLNPEVIYLDGDMRNVQLLKCFDAILIADAIDYMLSVEDLRQAFITAFTHAKLGAVFVTYFEFTKERFEQNQTRCSTDIKDNTTITYIENYHDPDPLDTTYEMTFVNLIRRNGVLDIEIDRHLGGIFDSETLENLLRETGFEIAQVKWESFGLMFVCLKPSQE